MMRWIQFKKITFTTEMICQGRLNRDDGVWVKSMKLNIGTGQRKQACECQLYQKEKVQGRVMTSLWQNPIMHVEEDGTKEKQL